MRVKTPKKRSIFRVVATSVIATLVAVLLVLNFSPGEKQIEKRIPRLYSTSDPQFLRSMGVLLGPPIVSGNRFEVLLNGDQIFPSMLAAIRGAKRTITFETYIYWSGAIGKEFADALSQRARAGVKVHVLLDWVGSSKMDEVALDEMRHAGVDVRKYHQPHWYNLGRLNNRTHRKILVVDGRIGYTGGVGIADQWSGNAQDPEHWRDTHFLAEGPVAEQMQAVFLDNWMKATGQVLHGDAYFPDIVQVGNSQGQMFSSSPSGGAESMHLMYLLSITAASESVHLSMSYFVPDELALQALLDALKRGVKIQIIVPGEHMDAETVRRASRARWGPAARRRGNLRISAHHVSLQGHGGGRLHGVGGIDQLRPALVPPQRRSESEHLQRHVRSAANRDLPPGPAQIAALYLRAVGPAAAAREGVGARRVAAGSAAVDCARCAEG